ncbi:low molecular weight protein-tyrosine-phosphatase [Burkholderia ubonensis]|uniref:protein-tyrosine-phosphatase n=1 Tax=Burkholderia ubonensis TaxID=101571 RepID=A0A102LRH3_9BURK|nr:low molecular weight protein-tyrosine-phosphatase [Burkholderia ubonensis]AOI68776.1 protein tyrosine phosphatase [Burkholderia ubonensis]KUZ18026.1 protein tyrosine phosphatase [Burkholderia ubonensis]KUZ22788.1 protein tyrosine phosphatase [Burkholderia ubonensis]KUZ37715.1 protein tyrosine phosphatase [Burkholderia ubonensis]KUZ46598.1 protein tyrosine phosphatase [Burkholderia ubonensis]
MIAVSTLLVICIGNVCRSPMAEVLLRARLPGFDVQSSGICALGGHGADPHAVALMRDRGLDLSSHRARQLSSQLCMRAGLILTMDLEQRRWLEHHNPALCGRVFRLGEFCVTPGGIGSGLDVPDPYLGPRTAFEHSLALIERGVESWCERIAPNATRLPANPRDGSLRPPPSARISPD